MPRRGFTLVELLVAIAIISILAAVAIPAYRIYKMNAYNTVAFQDLRNLVSDEECFYIQNHEYAPFSSSDIVNGTITVDVPPVFRHSFVSQTVVACAKVSSNGVYMNACAKDKRGNKVWGFESETEKFFFKTVPVDDNDVDAICPAATAGEDFSGWSQY